MSSRSPEAANWTRGAWVRRVVKVAEEFDGSLGEGDVGLAALRLIDDSSSKAVVKFE